METVASCASRKGLALRGRTARIQKKHFFLNLSLTTFAASISLVKTLPDEERFHVYEARLYKSGS